MTAIKDHFIDLERHRRQLEDNVTKLQTALQHWRMSDAEYEQLKDEVEAIPEPASRDDLERIREEFDGEVVTDKEVEELFGKSNEKPPAQIINLLSRRIDYVSKNIETLEKQVEAAEEKLAAATIVVNPDVRDEEGLPITDIIEQLDDDDNVTTYRLQRPGDLQPQIQEALAKAGIKELPEGGEKTESRDEENAPVDGKSQPESEVLHQSPPSPAVKKGVSFTEDTKAGHDPATSEEQPKTRTAQRLEEIMEQAQQQAAPLDNPVIPQNESAEDAALRREMLRYGMEEIAPIVAELEIDEEGESDFDDAYEDEDDDDDYDEEDEDEHGRYKYRVVGDDYRARMEELQKKLGFKTTRELETGDELQHNEEEERAEGRVPDEGIARIAVQPPPQAQSAMKSENQAADAKPAKKEVRFASALDVAESDSMNDPPATVPEPEQPFVDPMKAMIVERSPAPQPAAPVSTEPKKLSRFKKAKTARGTNALPIRQAPIAPKGPAEAPTWFLGQEDVRTAPTGPEGKTLAGTVLERDTPAEVREPDEFDAALLHQEAATEYHRMRNRMILKDGGFMKDKEAPIEYPEEEESGKRVSRFKAARLARQ
ncbi:hypothetical protein M406DRAFT_347411 [Cryphonectria parasitica EP155]|uniref:DUF3835 domain-containing protein n=1 Tax=Cryphonectria parasitica (strain ATCC 38755 / EP155) TaxID=660469 RepID=A0A9P5CKM4_CRYP1|nr:uncharacterized protein M406DRAFT_347411 [Cryphonectria parasitica EP155]KAF3762213.1 hypothetical protein M406DRAFT_347411 [Cryphonectria parasitica EP155]